MNAGALPKDRIGGRRKADVLTLQAAAARSAYAAGQWAARDRPLLTARSGRHATAAQRLETRAVRCGF